MGRKNDLMSSVSDEVENVPSRTGIQIGREVIEEDKNLFVRLRDSDVHGCPKHAYGNPLLLAFRKMSADIFGAIDR